MEYVKVKDLNVKVEDAQVKVEDVRVKVEDVKEEDLKVAEMNEVKSDEMVPDWLWGGEKLL